VLGVGFGAGSGAGSLTDPVPEHPENTAAASPTNKSAKNLILLPIENLFL
jgi:hypothetical protein